MVERNWQQKNTLMHLFSVGASNGYNTKLWTAFINVGWFPIICHEKNWTAKGSLAWHARFSKILPIEVFHNISRYIHLHFRCHQYYSMLWWWKYVVLCCPICPIVKYLTAFLFSNENPCSFKLISWSLMILWTILIQGVASLVGSEYQRCIFSLFFSFYNCNTDILVLACVLMLHE